MTIKSKVCIDDNATQVGLGGTKRLLMGLALALAVLFVAHDAGAIQLTIPLGSAAKFAILAATTVTSSGATTVNGNLGISPGTTVTGSPTVNGTTHLGDPTAAQAQGDLTIAYNNAAGRSGGAAVSGNLGGLTLF